ncbi:CCA tRNA nucleotidyltransferase [Candidatus Falkowbacteria bacterium]|nr:CCA tRNA nucleotidyltransferase [Candidatus Falkowbacteria bacterium]
MNIPEFVSKTISRLEKDGYEAFVVGGCVRDLLLGKTPKDWDITTNARPEQVLGVFADGKYENDFGTVLLPIKDEAGETLEVLEITTYRSEQGYSDRRHPDEVKFEDAVDKDLARRDFTINAMALKLLSGKSELAESDYEIIDLFGGKKDLGKRVIRAVGEPTDRFKEDSLRLMRAVRFSCQLGFDIEPKTERAMAKLAGGLKFIANERIRDELIKILSSDKPYEGIMKLHELKMLQYVMPELERGVGVAQNKHHVHTVFTHCVLSLKYCPSKDWRVRLATLLHDVAKPQTRAMKDGDATFYNHDYIGSKVVRKMTTRLKFSNEDADKITNLVKNHMFYYNVDEVTAAAVRRLIVKVGRENLKDLIDLRIGDRLGSGVAKAKPYKLRHLEYMIEKVSNDPISVKMLKIDGNDLMQDLGMPPGPKIGAILDTLLSEVIEEPDLNTKEYLSSRSQELSKLDLAELRERAKEKIEEKKMEDDQELKKGFWV